MATTAPKGQINVGIYDGTRAMFSDDTKVLYYVRDGAQQQVVSKYLSPQASFKLPFRDNATDNYTVIATLDGHGTSGYQPILISPKAVQIVNLMLLPDKRQFDFSGASWNNLQQSYPRIWSLLSGRVADPQNGNPQAQGFY